MVERIHAICGDNFQVSLGVSWDHKWKCAKYHMEFLVETNCDSYFLFKRFLLMHRKNIPRYINIHGNLSECEENTDEKRDVIRGATSNLINGFHANYKFLSSPTMDTKIEKVCRAMTD